MFLHVHACHNGVAGMSPTPALIRHAPGHHRHSLKIARRTVHQDYRAGIRATFALLRN